MLIYGQNCNVKNGGFKGAVSAIVWHQYEFGALRNYMPNYF
jgi:hypothetical protein